MYEAYFELRIMQSCSSRVRNKNMELGMSRMGGLVSFNVECFIYTVKYHVNKITFELSPFQQWCQRPGREISSSVSEPAASPSTPSHRAPITPRAGVTAGSEQILSITGGRDSWRRRQLKENRPCDTFSPACTRGSSYRRTRQRRPDNCDKMAFLN